jgi:hypothetical protein
MESLFTVNDTGPSGAKRWDLYSRFQDLGMLHGLSLQQIVAYVESPPSSISYLGPDRRLYQWIRLGCHVALIFDDNDMFVSVSHDYVNPSATRIELPDEAKNKLWIVAGVLAGLFLLLIIMNGIGSSH